MKNSSHGMLATVWAFPVLILSLFIFPYVTAGDQAFYRLFYEGASELSFSLGFVFYKMSLGTSEPGYFLLSYLLSSVMPKDVLFSVLNFALFQQLFLWMLRHDVSRALFPVLYCNFYLLVLAFSAERLKLALFFFMIGCSTAGLLRLLCLAVSVSTHVQVLILIALTQVEKLKAVGSELFQGRIGYGFVSLVFLITLMSAILFVLRSHIESKLGAYYGVWGGPGATLKPLVFTLLSVHYSKGSKLEALLVSLPLVLCAYLVGDERIVIFSYFVFMFYALQANRGINVGVVLTSLYFSYKGLLFLSYIISFGDGFSSGVT